MACGLSKLLTLVDSVPRSLSFIDESYFRNSSIKIPAPLDIAVLPPRRWACGPGGWLSFAVTLFLLCDLGSHVALYTGKHLFDGGFGVGFALPRRSCRRL